MKMIIVLAAAMLSVAANAATEVKTVTACAASADVNQGTLAIETVTNMIFAPIDLTTGALLDVGGMASPLALVKVSEALDTTAGTVTVNYTVTGSTSAAQAILTFKTNTDVVQYELVSATVGTDFSAPVLVKDQATTDALIKDNGPGFVCSTGDATFFTADQVTVQTPPLAAAN